MERDGKNVFWRDNIYGLMGELESCKEKLVMS